MNFNKDKLYLMEIEYRLIPRSRNRRRSSGYPEFSLTTLGGLSGDL